MKMWLSGLLTLLLCSNGMAVVASSQSWPREGQHFVNVCNLAGTSSRSRIMLFSQAMHNAGLWTNMVCWPLRSTENIGLGTRAESLGGIGRFPARLTNSLGWTTNGLTNGSIYSRALSNFNYSSATPSLIFVATPNLTGQGSGQRYASNDQAATSNGIGIDDYSPSGFRSLSADAAQNQGTRTAGTRTMFGIGFGTNNTYWFQNGSRTTKGNLGYNASTQTLAVVGSPQAETASATFTFTIAFDGVVMNSTLLTAFYNAYKTTLGSDLNLP